MKSLCIVSFIAVLCVYALCVFADAAAIDETKLRCKVCDRAIAHVWTQGVALRKHCKLHNTDPRCYHSNIQKSAVEELITDACDDVVRHNTATYSDAGVFTMVPVEDDAVAANNEELNAVMTKSCKKWVLEKNTIATLTRFVYANLDAGKPTQAILNPLQKKFCTHACLPPVEENDNDEL